MKFENTEVAGFRSAIRAMRNPLASWSKSDSYTSEDGTFILGDADKALAQRLIKAGSEHRKFLRQIYVAADITAPAYYMSEFDTYKIGTTRNSTSFMHKGTSKPFTLDDFELSENPTMEYWDAVIRCLNIFREEYLRTKDYSLFVKIREMLPMAYIYRSTWTANYEVVRNIVIQRRHHRLPIWQDFIKWSKELPYSEELIWCGVDDE